MESPHSSLTLRSSLGLSHPSEPAICNPSRNGFQQPNDHLVWLDEKQLNLQSRLTNEIRDTCVSDAPYRVCARFLLLSSCYFGFSPNYELSRGRAIILGSHGRTFFLLSHCYTGCIVIVLVGPFVLSNETVDAHCSRRSYHLKSGS